MINVILRGKADVAFHRLKKEKAFEFDMVDVWAHFEAIQEGELPPPCKAGRCANEYFTTAQDAMFYTCESSQQLWVDNIVQVIAGKSK